MSDSNSSAMPWVLGGLGLVALVGGGFYVASRNADADAQQKALAAELQRVQDEARRERELASMRANAPATQSTRTSSTGNPLDLINTIGGAIKGVTDFFSGFKVK